MNLITLSMTFGGDQLRSYHASFTPHAEDPDQVGYDLEKIATGIDPTLPDITDQLPEPVLDEIHAYIQQHLRSTLS